VSCAAAASGTPGSVAGILQGCCCSVNRCQFVQAKVWFVCSSQLGTCVCREPCSAVFQHQYFYDLGWHAPTPKPYTSTTSSTTAELIKRALKASATPPVYTQNILASMKWQKSASSVAKPDNVKFPRAFVHVSLSSAMNVHPTPLPRDCAWCLLCRRLSRSYTQDRLQPECLSKSICSLSQSAHDVCCSRCRRDCRIAGRCSWHWSPAAAAAAPTLQRPNLAQRPLPRRAPRDVGGEHLCGRPHHVEDLQ
jgi:hypothetical protein